MTRPLRKLPAAFAGLAFGLLGLTIVATPAQAAADHTATITAYGVCDISAGEWVITWKFANQDANKSATLSAITPSQNTALSTIDNGAVVPGASTVSGIQRFPGSVTTATLAVDATWPYAPEFKSTINGSWSYNNKACSKTASCVPLAAGTLQHTFSAVSGSATATATIQRKGYQPFMSLCAVQPLTLVSYFALSAGFALPQYVFDFVKQDFTMTTYELTFTVAMPPCFTQVDFVTGDKFDSLYDGGPLYNDRKIGSGSGPGAVSTGPSAWYNGNGTKGGVCANPAATVAPKCDGSGTVHLSNGLVPSFANVIFNWTLNGATPADSPKTLAPNTSYSFTVINSQFPIEVTGNNGFKTTLNWSWPERCEQPVLLVEPDCSSLILKVTNPSSTPVDATATYNGSSQTKTVGTGATAVFTFAAGTGSATVALNGAPYWTGLTASFTDSDSCHLPNTGTSVTTVVGIGAALVAAGGLLVFVVARQMGRRRRTA